MSLGIKNSIRIKDFFSVKTSFASIFMFACLGIVAFAGMSLWQSHQQYKKGAEITTRNLCNVLSDNLISSYQKIDIAVLGVKDEVEREFASGGIDGPRLEAFIKHRIEWIPVLFALRTANTEGIIDHGNKVVPGSRISVADRDYFIRLKSDPDAGLVFSKPLTGRVTGYSAIILARRINNSNGRFAGVAYGAVELEKVRAYFESLAIGQDGVITLRDSDLSVILRKGSSMNATGQSTVSREFKALVEAGRTSGTFTAVSQVDNIERIYSFIKLQPYGQYLYVGLGCSEVYASWRKELYKTIFFASLFIIIIGTSSFLAYKAWQRQQQAEAEQERVIVELEKSLEEVKVLSGLIPICSSCKKIRDDNGYWNQIESYISSHSEAQFSHGICPDCVEILYPDISKKIKSRQE